MSRSSKSYGSNNPRSQKKPALWQLFFDEEAENAPGANCSASARATSTGRQTVDPTNDEFNTDEIAAASAMGKFRKVPMDGTSAAQSLLKDGDNTSLDDEFLGTKSARYSQRQHGEPPDLDLGVSAPRAREDVLRESVLNGTVTYIANQSANRPFSDENWEPMSMDGNSQVRPPAEPRVLIRTDSDLELAGPARSGTWGAACRECKEMCHHRGFWRRYVFVLLVIALALAVYAGLIVAIVKGMR